MRMLELFCGIGGAAEAFGPSVCWAVDQNRQALQIYQQHHTHRAIAQNIVGIKEENLPEADLWWLSPPCQPYTQRGKQQDLQDPRSAPFLKVLDWIAALRPEVIALENVPGFQDSEARSRLLETVHDYDWEERCICPTELGIPMRRRRYYFLAMRRPFPERAAMPVKRRALHDYLDPHPDPALRLDPAVLRAYPHALNLLDPADPAAIATCFTAAYGRSPVRSGSYLQTPDGPRHFSLLEGARLMGFGRYSGVGDWGLLGNSLSVDVVRWWLSRLQTP